MKPRTNLLHWPKGRYVNAASTDLRETFKRVRKEQALRERIERDDPPPNVIRFGGKQ